MSRKKCMFTLMVLALALALIPGVHAKSPIDNVVVVKDLPEALIAGSTYEMIITFDNVAQESVPLIVEVTVTCAEAPLGYDEVIIEEIKLNDGVLTCAEVDPGVFRTEEGTLEAESSNELRIVLSSLVNLMPGTYIFEIDLLGEEPINKPPVADAGDPYSGEEGDGIAFDGTGSYDPDGNIVSYVWNFGDEETGTGATPIHTYDDSGTYTVTLTVTDDEGASDSDTATVTITEAPPETGTLSIDTTPVKGEVFVDGDTWGLAPVDVIVGKGTHAVTFGDVAGYTTPEPQVVDVEADETKEVLGTYTKILMPPVANAGGPYSCERYETITLDGSESKDPDGEIISYEWDFGDGTKGTTVNPSHIYSSARTYTIKLTVTDDDGLTDSDTTYVKVSKPLSPEPSPGKPNKKPKADAGPNMKISVGSPIHFNGGDSYDPDGPTLSYRWDFGDGTTATGKEVDHTYSEPGHYTVTLVVKDNRGAEDSDKCIVFVWEPPAPVADKFRGFVPGEQKGFKIEGKDATSTVVTLDTISQVTVTILRYEENPHPGDPMPPKALSIYVDVEVSDPDAVEWPIYVEMFYTDEEAEGLDESMLGIYYWMDGEWKRCSDTGVDTERNVVWAYMTEEEASGSPILVGYTPKPAEFILSDLSITPAEVEPGEEVIISFLVTNVGEEKGVCTVTLSVGDEPMTMVATLEGGESEEMDFEYTPETEGSYQVIVDGLIGSFMVKAPTVPPKPAAFEVSDLVVSPVEVVEGEQVTVKVKVTNVGEEEGSHTVVLKLDGVTVDTAETTLGGGDSATITFTLTEAVGEYSLDVDGLTDGFTVTAPPGLSPGYVAGILILIIAAGAAVYMLYRGGRLTLPKSPPGPENLGDYLFSMVN